MIQSGELLPGARLLPTRELARISRARGIPSWAYEQRVLAGYLVNAARHRHVLIEAWGIGSGAHALEPSVAPEVNLVMEPAWV